MTHPDMSMAQADISDLNVARGDPFDMAPGESWGAESWNEWDEEPQPAAPARDWTWWMLPALMLVLLAAWTGGFLWANRAAMVPGMTPATALGWVAQWSGPAVLLAMVWYGLHMGGTRSALRMGEAARQLRGETRALEDSLTAMNRELSLAREFIAAQARDLDALGRQSVERLSQHGDHLAGLVRENADRVQVIGSVGEAALLNMKHLREQLPIITSSTKDLTNTIGNAGRVAQAHLQDMVVGLNRMNDFGVASERQVESLRDRVGTALSDLEQRSGQLGRSIEQRFEGLEQRSQGFAMDLERHESDAREALLRRSATLDDEIASARTTLDSEEAQSLTSLRARLSGLRDETATIARALRDTEGLAQSEWQASLDRINRQLGDMDGAIARRSGEQLVQAQALGEAARVAVARFEALDARLTVMGEANRGAVTDIAERMEQMERRLKEADRSVAALTDGSVRLLELIQASARYGAQELPAALSTSEHRLERYEGRIAALGEALAQARGDGETLAEHVATAEARLATATQAMGGLHDGLDGRVGEHAVALAGLRGTLAAMEQDTARLAGQAQGELTRAIQLLDGAARQAVAAIEEEGASRVSALAARLGTDSAASIERAMRNQTAEIAGHLEQSAAHAAGLAKEAASQLRKQMAQVDELAGNLERRVADARERAEEQVDNDFARRVALITETLNSNAIDIAKALDADIGETAWAAYLRGERGIFTRRAVKLLDNAEAKSVLGAYEGDPHFANEVNRYIHDFEALLRQLLSTRDGHALGVTLLSSDVGKLYVALAQAIERLRS